MSVATGPCLPIAQALQVPYCRGKVRGCNWHESVTLSGGCRAPGLLVLCIELNCGLKVTLLH